ncbi:MAG: type II toxin-antitoxin system PemK/MazF family toxin [Thermodesulfovibrionales bacterium]|nr:type II toxin-antitoxin system PemK/MazF family toxin [Thermodesulfovibrionales bacterium]MDP3112110.1 type II toxin-antitoxin system PemK/MazF family toxin [Thermodesulfovibrionales bacterium]
MTIRKFHVYTADLNPRFGTEPGKIRPVVVIQTNLLNDEHPSTIVCPITTNVQPKAEILRIHLKKGEAGLKKASDIIVDQIRSIDNTRFAEHLGEISEGSRFRLLNNLKILLLE